MTRAKKRASLLIVLLLIGCWLPAQNDEIFILSQAVDRNKTIVYKRVIGFVKSRKLWQVRDYFENGQLQMDAFYSSLEDRGRYPLRDILSSCRTRSFIMKFDLLG